MILENEGGGTGALATRVSWDESADVDPGNLDTQLSKSKIVDGDLGEVGARVSWGRVYTMSMEALGA